MIVDVDTHWEATGYASGEHPARTLASTSFPAVSTCSRSASPATCCARCRPSRSPAADGAAARAWCAWPKQRGGPIILHPLHESSPAERVGWMDRIGIDHCLVNPGGYWQQLEFLGADRAAGVRRCNDFLGEQLADRRRPAARRSRSSTSPTSTRRSTSSSARGRAARRAFFLYTEQRSARRAASRPVIPTWDPRVGRGHAPRDGRGRSTSATPRPTSPAGPTSAGTCPAAPASPASTRLANTQRIHAAQNLLSALLYGGVFARHPTLTVMLEEMRVNWVPPFVADARTPVGVVARAGRLAVGDVRRRHVAAQRAGHAAARASATTTRSTCSPSSARDRRVLVGLSPPGGQRRPDRALPARARRARRRAADRVHGRERRGVLRPHGRPPH